MNLNLPYSALRAFDAVVRQRGFSAAAEELGISQSAVSQHISSLEEWLGHKVLLRGGRHSVPTPEGEQLAAAVSEGFGRISDVCAHLRDKTLSDKALTIACLPGFAFIWLFPRLLRFDLAHPELSISIATDTGSRPFSGSNADIGIYYGLGDYPGLQVEHLMNERLFPVCAPSLLEGENAITTVDDLTKHTLLQDENLVFGASNPTWDFWARQCSLKLPSKLNMRRFGQSNLVIQAAIEGVGVALGREPLVIDALVKGQLTMPFSEIVQSPLSYWLVQHPRVVGSQKGQKFLAWIHGEVANQPDLPAKNREAH